VAAFGQSGGRRGLYVSAGIDAREIANAALLALALELAEVEDKTER
jgi:pyruvate dehydrogenase complex dehydrogenase (E1) component